MHLSLSFYVLHIAKLCGLASQLWTQRRIRWLHTNFRYALAFAEQLLQMQRQVNDFIIGNLIAVAFQHIPAHLLRAVVGLPEIFAYERAEFFIVGGFRLFMVDHAQGKILQMRDESGIIVAVSFKRLTSLVTDNVHKFMHQVE